MADGRGTGSGKTAPIEIHFQEIFSGERIEVLAGGAIVADVTAKTRFQTGLAHIERLRLRDGEEVTLRIPALGLETKAMIEAARPYLAVTLSNGRLSAHSVVACPGYV